MWTSPGNVRNSFYSYNDRGRGPELRASVTLGANGVPVSVHVTGHDYLKAEVTEDFSIKNGIAKWKNNSEQGEGRSAHPAFYLRLSEAPDDPALLVKALLAAGGKLALLPEGEARLEHVGEGNVKAEGKILRVTQYAISGLGFSPEYVWLDPQRKFIRGRHELVRGDPRRLGSELVRAARYSGAGRLGAFSGIGQDACVTSRPRRSCSSMPRSSIAKPQRFVRA